MSDPITEAAAMLAAHPDSMVRLIAERLAGARVRHRAAGLSRDDVARRMAVAAAARQHRGTAVWAVADCGGPIAGQNRPAPTAANRVRSALAGHCSVCSTQTASRRGAPCRRLTGTRPQ